MKKKFFAALAASVMLCGVLTVPAAADTAAAEENKTAVTQPVSSDEIREKELFGLSVDASAFTLNVGETRELKVSLNTDYYLADSLHFYSDDQSVAWVYPYIGGHVIGTSAGTAAIQVSARLDKNKVKLSPEDNGERSVTVKVTVTEPILSESQKAALKRLEEAEQNGRGFYLRERAVITGAISADAPRLTLDEANRIVDPSQPCEKVWKTLMDAQIYPDYYDTGDPTSLVYWLDDRGQEVIGIQDYSMIHYSRADENGILQEVQYLYPERQEPIYPTETTANVMFRNYHEVYGGPYTPELQEQLYGLSVDTSMLTLNVGETRELKVSLNPDYYLADSLHFYSDDKSVAWVYPYIGGHVIGTSAGTATIQVSAKLDKNKVMLSPEDNGERSVMVKVTVTEPTLSESQKAALKKLEEAEKNGRGIYLRERAIITGVLAADAPRLTLDEANSIVDPSQPCEKVWKALMDARIYPDYYDTVDPTSLVYWLDNRGQEVIGIQDFSIIHYSRADENGVLQEVQYLYPERQEPIYPTETTTNVMFRNYHEVYGGPYTPEPVQGIATMLGDANCDGSIDVSDAVLIARFAAEDREATMTDQGRQNADVTHDGNVDGQDSTKILQYIAKQISLEDLAK